MLLYAYISNSCLQTGKAVDILPISALQHGAMMVPMELIHVLLALCISCVIADPQNVALYKNITALFSCGVFGDEVSVPFKD